MKQLSVISCQLLVRMRRNQTRGGVPHLKGQGQRGHDISCPYKAKRTARIGCATLRGDGEDAEGTAGAVDDFEGRGDDDGAGGRQLIEIAEAGEAEFSAAVHYEMI